MPLIREALTGLSAADDSGNMADDSGKTVDDMADDSGKTVDDTVLVKLKPFVHQVGGHTCVLQIDHSTICKPHEAREVWFYTHQPEELKRFTPVYIGGIEVICDICDDKTCLYGRIPSSLAVKQGWTVTNGPDEVTNLASGTTRRGRKRSHSSSQSNPITGSPHLMDQERDLNGWSKQCIERQIHRYGFWSNNRAQQFTVLENLVHDYQRPCMMDLKMGRRQFGDDSSLEKRKLLESRCAESTSASLGFRICGMQVYRESTQSYTVHDKYHGRGLDDAGVGEELRSFYHSGTALRKAVLLATIDRLKELKSCLLKQNTLNFFSCSLLLIYEGETHAHSETENHTACTSTNTAESISIPEAVEACNHADATQDGTGGKRASSDVDLLHNTSDENIGFLRKGSEIEQASGDTDDLNNSSNNKKVSGDVGNLYKDFDGKRASSDTAVPLDNSKGKKASSGQDCGVNVCNDNSIEDKVKTDSARIDVRLIDFAHVSETSASESTNDAENTIVFGLDHLVHVLTQIVQ